MKNFVLRALRIVLGLIITTLGYWAFLNPHSISVGGITGVCVVLNEHFGLSYTGTLLVLNTALFVWGIKVKGLCYVVRSLGAMITLGLLLDLEIPVPLLVGNLSKEWAMVFGSVLTGVGYGMIVSADTSTGGSDLLAMIVVKTIPRMTVGMIMNGVDLLVVMASGLLDGMHNILFSVAAMLLCNTFIDVASYYLGKGELPGWLLRLKKCGHAFSARLGYRWPQLVPWVALAGVCIFFLLTRDVIIFEKAIMGLSA